MASESEPAQGADAVIEAVRRFAQARPIPVYDLQEAVAWQAVVDALDAYDLEPVPYYDYLGGRLQEREMCAQQIELFGDLQGGSSRVVAVQCATYLRRLAPQRLS